tara:strand:+ start:1027 stop:1266 length:240 start_codon:yes stop_codon:yes gene_type:complete
VALDNTKPKQKENKMTNFKAMVLRINKAVTISDLKALEISLSRLITAGVITTSEFWKLDDKILNRIFKLETDIQMSEGK